MTDKRTVNRIPVDEKVAKAILRKIVLKEAQNLKTKKNNPSEMVAIVQKIIQEGVECD